MRKYDPLYAYLKECEKTGVIPIINHGKMLDTIQRTSKATWQQRKWFLSKMSKMVSLKNEQK